MRGQAAASRLLSCDEALSRPPGVGGPPRSPAPRPPADDGDGDDSDGSESEGEGGGGDDGDHWAASLASQKDVQPLCGYTASLQPAVDAPARAATVEWLLEARAAAVGVRPALSDALARFVRPRPPAGVAHPPLRVPHLRARRLPAGPLPQPLRDQGASPGGWRFARAFLA